MEKHYLSNSVMLETLAKVQSMQIEIVKTGRSCHLDVSVIYNSFFDLGATHISIDVNVFEDNEIVKDFEFDASDSQKELQAEIMRMEAYVDRIKKEA